MPRRFGDWRDQEVKKAPREEEIDRALASLSGNANFLTFMAYLRSISMNQVLQEDASDSALRRQEGRRSLYADAMNRIERATANVGE